MCVSHLTTTIFTGLKILHCQHTLVSSLPVGLHELSLLEELHAHHCRLQTIDGRLGLLPHLHVINCTSNPIWSPPSESLDLSTADLKRVLSGLVLTQQPHAVSSHIMLVHMTRVTPKKITPLFRYRNRKCQLLGVAWDVVAGRMVARVKDVGTGQVGIRDD